MALTQLTGEVLDEKYRIDKELGRGGMGAVYLATHLGTDRPVAVKVITPQFMMNDEFVERFKREAKAAGRLHHPNVVNVTDFGFARVAGERIAYLVMEYLDGCTLAEVLAEESKLQIDWVIDIIEQTCSAVDEAHQQGIIHRDLKPDNIWLEPNRRGGYTVKVLDFGLAKLGDAPGFESDSSFSSSNNRAALPTQAASEARNTEFIERKTLAASSDGPEAATRLQPSAEHLATLILEQSLQPDASASAEDAASETATQLLPASNVESVASKRSEEERTRVLDHTTDEHLPRQTVPADGLTRVGSILGTPLYMSPEQCRSEPLDARSDIYSLGVIAYQMLAGEPPFTGSADEVMRLHIEAAPRPLKEKRRKIRKRMSNLVMTALSKQPQDRPASAAGFASALRANAEGTGALLRRAFTLYIEHFPKFFRVAVLMYIPLIALHIALLVSSALKPTETQTLVSGSIKVTATPTSATEIIISIATFFVNFFVNAVIAGVTIRLVTQLFLAPLRPLELRTAYASMRRRLKALLVTIAIASIRSFVGLLLLVIPGVIMFINYSLAAPVVMMEGLKGRAALKRSKSLVKRSKRTVILILLFQWAIPACTGAIVGALLSMGLKLSRTPNAPMLSGRITAIIIVALNAFIVPLIATLTALLYLKTRQLGGETLREALSQFEEEDAPRARWQMRMRERLHSSKSSLRSDRGETS
jgi:serine/threonine protein kinase